MLRLTSACVITLGLLTGGCSSQQVTTKVSNAVVATEVALTAAEQLATLYATRPRCPLQVPPMCSDPATVARIKALDQIAYGAVKAAESNEALLAGAIQAVNALRAAVPGALAQ